MQRLVVGMSQEALADRLGLTFQQVQKYEKGTNRISASRMHQISDALNVPMTYLFEGLPATQQRPDDIGIAPQISDFLATKDGLALIMAFAAIDDADLRRTVVELVQKIAARK